MKKFYIKDLRSFQERNLCEFLNPRPLSFLTTKLRLSTENIQCLLYHAVDYLVLPKILDLFGPLKWSQHLQVKNRRYQVGPPPALLYGVSEFSVKRYKLTCNGRLRRHLFQKPFLVLLHPTLPLLLVDEPKEKLLEVGSGCVFLVTHRGTRCRRQ